MRMLPFLLTQTNWRWLPRTKTIETRVKVVEHHLLEERGDGDRCCCQHQHWRSPYCCYCCCCCCIASCFLLHLAHPLAVVRHSSLNEMREALDEVGAAMVTSEAAARGMNEAESYRDVTGWEAEVLSLRSLRIAKVGSNEGPSTQQQRKR